MSTENRKRVTQRGMVTVEMAFAALGIGVLIVVCTGLVAVGLAQIQCNDAAAQIARQVARDDLEAVAQIKARLPQSALVSITQESRQVEVEVTITVRPWGKWLPAISLTGRACVLHESGG